MIISFFDMKVRSQTHLWLDSGVPMEVRQIASVILLLQADAILFIDYDDLRMRRKFFGEVILDRLELLPCLLRQSSHRFARVNMSELLRIGKNLL